MENTILNELLEKSNKGGKRVDLSKRDQNIYRSEFLKCLSQEGLNDNTVDYFIKGIKSGTAGALMNWMNKIPEDKLFATYQALTQNKMFVETDSVSQFRITLALTATFLSNLGKYEGIIADLFHNTVKLSKKKDGKQLTELSKLFKAYFMDNMSSNTQLPLLSKYHFDEEYKKQLVDMLELAVAGIEPKGDIEIDKINALKKWVQANKCVAGEQATNIPISEKEENTIAAEQKTLPTEPTKPVEEIKGSLARKLLDIAKVVSICELENRNVRDVVSEKEAEISRLKMSISKYQSQNKSMADEIDALKKEHEIIKEQLERLSIENKELSDRVGRQSEVINVFDQDKDNSKTELLNQIATGLKNIYADYKVAENMDMTVDLGLNMRDALQDVFRKLKKMGIDIEGR